MDLARQLDLLKEKISAACLRSGRQPEEVTLVAVSKGQPPDQIEAATRLGLRAFGENRIQELKAKIEPCPSSISWHMIGHLQSNKAREAMHLCDLIQSVDSLRLAEELQKWGEKLDKKMPVLLEVNVAGESSKFGYQAEKLFEDLPALAQFSRLELKGLMTIAPWTTDPEKVRPVFRKLHELKLDCEQRLEQPLPILSMGMSGDYEVAVEEGATMVRIGTALFGPRPKWKPSSIDSGMGEGP